jgi:hypothetical protein
MNTSTLRTGVGCKFFGLWLLVTSGVLIWGETAPLVLEPSFGPALLCLGLGSALFYFGCFCCRRAKGGFAAPADNR